MEGEVKATLKSLDEKVDRLIDAVLGNGHTGLIIRVDRLERRASFLNKLTWTVAGGAIVALATAITTAFMT